MLPAIKRIARPGRIVSEELRIDVCFSGGAEAGKKEVNGRPGGRKVYRKARNGCAIFCLRKLGAGLIFGGQIPNEPDSVASCMVLPLYVARKLVPAHRLPDAIDSP